jgi:Flp pilus assembly protein TadG
MATATAPQDRGEQGTITVFVTIMAFALLVIAGLVYDGGVALAAKRRAINVAEQAARAGAQELDVPLLRSTGAYQVDPGLAQQSASAYLSSVGYSGTVAVNGNVVQVSNVPWSHDTFILGAIGVNNLGGSVQADARLIHGVVVEEGT